ncbi:hypothetical protein [Nocardia salmonicida]|uniref:hypothetical protein n=1 Tax=Nocardia salmonicida TaxID=53431 RepID=UPI003791BF13
MTTVLLYAEGPAPAEVICIGEFRDAQPDLATRHSGTRPYKVGVIAIRTDDLVALDVAGFPDRTFWVSVDGEYMRIQTASASHATGGGMLAVDQSEPAVHLRDMHSIDSDDILRVIEPSPPRPVAEWLPVETARVIREWHALQDMAIAVDAALSERGIEFPA